MAIAIRFETTGKPSVLRIESTSERRPGAGEVWLEQDAIGVNYLDVSQRSGAVPMSLPSGLGLEAAGHVTAVGPGVSNVKVGQRVAYILGPIGSYASGRLYPAERLIALPDEISVDEAATVLFKGITAHYLLHSTFTISSGDVVVIYGVAGALGQIMARWAKALGAYVIGVVSKQASVARAQAVGCNAVFVWNTCDLPTEVAKVTNGQKANAVYDGIGKATFAASLDCLRPRGFMVSFGASTGIPDPISVTLLNTKGSLYLTRPSLAAYATEIEEYRQRANAVFEALTTGIIRPAAWNIYPLSEAAKAHTALEEGRSEGAILLKP